MKKSVLFSLHAIVWAVVILFVTLIGWRNANGDWFLPSSYGILNSFVAASWMIAIFYVFYLFLFPRYFKPKQYFNFLLLSIAVVLTLPLCFHLTFESLHLIFRGNFDGISLPGYLGGIVATIFIGGLGSLFRIIIDWFTNAQEKSELDTQNFRSELKLLKYQLNPHFLFNTLNNIDSLIQENNQNASLALNKLSGIMRYMIYDSEKEKVSLKDELTYIENYISLQKLRFTDENKISFNITGNTDNVQIAPMLFITFVENAFKHSSLKKAGNNISIKLDVLGNQINFSCINSLPSSPAEKDDTSGIGLELIKKRLELIYSKAYELKLDETEESFAVYLKIRTNAN